MHEAFRLQRFEDLDLARLVAAVRAARVPPVVVPQLVPQDEPDMFVEEKALPRERDSISVRIVQLRHPSSAGRKTAICTPYFCDR